MDERQQQELEEERLQRLEWAFQELTDKQVSQETMQTLMFETGYSIMKKKEIIMSFVKRNTQKKGML